MITVSKAEILDAGTVVTIMQDYSRFIVDDYHIIDPEIVLQNVQAGRISVLRLGLYPVGLFYYADIFEDLHATVYFIVRPKHLREVIQRDLFGQLLQSAFDETGVLMLKALLFEHNKGGRKLATRYRFKNKGIDENYTRCGGKMTDLFRFELKRCAWDKWRSL